MRTNARTIAAFVAGALLASAGTATAGKLITGRQIKDGSISAKDLNAAIRAQLAKAGLPGPAGPTGAAGPVGPSFGIANTGFGIPSITPDGTIPPGAPVTTAASGKLFVYGTLENAGTGGSCSGVAKLYIDDIPVFGTYAAVNTTKRDITMIGMTLNSVPAGTHTVVAKVDCISGTFSSASTDFSSYGAIVLGNQ